jgi:hypothetical protein
MMQRTHSGSNSHSSNNNSRMEGREVDDKNRTVKNGKSGEELWPYRMKGVIIVMAV